MAKSILQSTKECYVCRQLYCVSTRRALEDHHIFGGARRPISERYGLKVWLCQGHHNRSNEYSAHFDPELRRFLHEAGQAAFVERYGPERWTAEFGKDYSPQEGA